MDLLNLSSSTLPSQLPPANLEADFLNLNAEDSQPPPAPNLVDVSDDLNFGAAGPQTAPGIENNEQSDPGTSFDLLGDLGMFTSKNAQPAAESATVGGKKANDVFDPFSMGSFESRVSFNRREFASRFDELELIVSCVVGYVVYLYQCDR